EVELAGQLHIELALADKLPGQLAAGKAAFKRRTFGVDGVGDRRECRGKVAGLRRCQAFLRWLRRPKRHSGRDPGHDFPKPWLDPVGERRRGATSGHHERYREAGPHQLAQSQNVGLASSRMPPSRTGPTRSASPVASSVSMASADSVPGPSAGANLLDEIFRVNRVSGSSFSIPITDW